MEKWKKGTTNSPREMHLKKEKQNNEVKGQRKKVMVHRYVCRLGHNRNGTTA